jgi:predicted transcriptional regulator
MCMGKKPFTTRLDGEVLDLAQRLAEAERRSVTSLIEMAILEYAERRGELPPKRPVPPVAP